MSGLADKSEDLNDAEKVQKKTYLKSTATHEATLIEVTTMLRSPPSRPVVPPPMIYSGRLSSEQVAMLEAEFTKGKTLHSTDLSLLAAEMAVNERDVQAWYQQRMAAWRREQGLSDCFGQV